MRRLIALLFFLVFGGVLSSASAASLTLLGTNLPARSTYYPSIHVLKAYNGRIYMGYGDWENYPGVVMVSYDPLTGAFHHEFSCYTDAIGTLREIGGRLYAPSIDPVHFEDFHELSYRENGVWRDLSPVGMLHVFDIGTSTGTDLWVVGAKAPDETTNYNAAVFRSLDGGRTWASQTIQSSQLRYYYCFPLRGKFYVHDTVYENGVGTRVPTGLYPYFYKPVPMGSGSQEFVVGINQRLPGSPPTFYQTLMSFDTTAWRAFRPNVYDFTKSGDELYVLEGSAAGGPIWLSRGSSVTATQAVWQKLLFQGFPLEATAVEVMDGVAYIGDALGRLWAGRLDGTPLVPPTASVVNDLDDEFGRGLAVDRNTLAVGAPGYSERSIHGGQVSVWERNPNSELENDWTRTAVIDPPQTNFMGWFGRDIVLKGDVLAVAETGRDTTRRNRGVSSQVHVYQRAAQGWVLRQTLAQSFIHSVIIEGDLLVIGTSAQAYFYQLAKNSNDVLTVSAVTNISSGITLSSPIYEPVMRVAMESNVFVMSLSGDLSRYGGPGEVNVFERTATGAFLRTNSLHREQVAPPYGAPLKPDGFGFSVALRNGWLAVGAPRDDTVALQSGAVHMYQRTLLTNGAMSFELRETIYSPIPQFEARFGASVALTDSRLIVGSPGIEVDGRRHHGCSYIYQYSGSNWVQIGELRSPVQSTGESGIRVAIGSDWVAVGSRFSDASTNLLERVALFPHLEPFPTWLAFHGLQGTDGSPSSDLDGDSANNLVEFACNLDPWRLDALPLDPISGRSGLPSVQRVESGGETFMSVTELRRRNASLAKLTYASELSADLQTWVPSATEPHSVQSIDAQWEKVTFRFPIPADVPQLFYRTTVQLEGGE